MKRNGFVSSIAGRRCVVVPPRCRPRVTAGREQEIYQAALELVAQQGYDRLTLDAVAQQANASKATLYRRWGSKAGLVVEAVCQAEPVLDDIDTGSLRGDLLALVKAKVGYFDQDRISVLSALVTALHRDPEFAEAFRVKFLGERQSHGRLMFERARERGEITGEVDLDLLASVIPAMLVFHLSIGGHDQPIEALAMTIIDQLVLPAARGRQT
jgi:AcrR family transcriptional regulator